MNAVLALEKKKIEENPHYLIRNGYLKIRVKEPKPGEGFIQNLYPTNFQSRFLDFHEQTIKENILPRYWILKARQVKGTTISASLIYARNSQKGGRTAFVVADDLDGAHYIFSMAKLFQEYIEKDYPHLAPEVKYSTRKELVFGDLKTAIYVDTANNVALGQKYTIQDALFSEVAKYPEHAREMFVGFLQAMPRHMDTLFINESTANGIGGLFYEEVMKAYEGRSDWRLFFGSFLEEPEYRIEIDEEQKQFLEKTLDKEEEGLITIHGADFEQLWWRRHCIINYCSGYNEWEDPAKKFYLPRKLKRSIDNFHQYYPVTVPQAFIASGNCKFDTEILSQWLSLAPKFAQKNEDLIPGHNYIEGFFFLDENGYLEFFEQLGGPWKIFYFPEEGIDYAMGCDVAEGIEEEGSKEWDWSTIVFIRRDTLEQVAEYRAHIEPDLLAFECFKGLCFYNSPMAGIEANKDGQTTIKFLREQYNYQNIYVREIIEEEKYKRRTKKLGWLTTGGRHKGSRNILINDLQVFIRNEEGIFYSSILISECLSFIQKPDGMASAQSGCFDDLVFAAGIALQMHYLTPKTEAWKQRKRLEIAYR